VRPDYALLVEPLVALRVFIPRSGALCRVAWVPKKITGVAKDRWVVLAGTRAQDLVLGGR
jgi:hypothetical protein